MQTFWRDLRYGLRQMSKRPWIAAAAVASMALGIGANTAVFTFANALLLQPLPVRDANRLVAIFSTGGRGHTLLPVAYHDFEDYRRAGGQAFAELAAHRLVNLDLSGDAKAERIQGEIASGNYFALLGVGAALGRTFGPEEDLAPGAHPVAVLSHGLWQRRFAEDRSVIGREIRLNNHVFKVIGVAPRGFRGIDVLKSPELWVPMAMHDQILVGDVKRWFDSRSGLLFDVVGRLRPGVGVGAATASLRAVAGVLARQYPQDNAGRSVALVRLGEAMIDPNVRGNYLRGGTLLLAAASLLFLIACANVAGLLLTQAVGRKKEMAIRLSLGADQGRLIRQLLTEGMILALAGGAAGLLVAASARDLLWSLRPPSLPETLEVGFDWRVLGFALLLSLGAGLALGLAPALLTFGDSLVPHLKNDATPGGNRGRLTLRKSLVALQVALGVVLLTGAALCLSSLWNARGVELGFNPERLILISFSPGTQGYDEAVGRQLYQRILEQVEQLDGVQSATLGQSVPLVAAGKTHATVIPEGHASAEYRDEVVGVNVAGPRYFETLGIPLRAGRVFDGTDRRDSRAVVVVNAAMAKELWGGESAVGKRLEFGGEDRFAEVIGVVSDSTYDDPGEGPKPHCYRPSSQRYSGWMTLHVRTTRDPSALLPAVRRRVQDVDGNMPLFNVRLMSQVVEQSLWARRMAAWLLTSFGVLALVLAALGVYGVVAYSVSQRGHEFSVRLAVGARRQDIMRLVYLQGVPLCAAGLVLGLAAALLARPLLAHFLYGVESPSIVGLGSAVLLFVVALAAIYPPARKATRAAPVQALRGGGR